LAALKLAQERRKPIGFLMGDIALLIRVLSEIKKLVINLRAQAPPDKLEAALTHRPIERIDSRQRLRSAKPSAGLAIEITTCKRTWLSIAPQAR
jgi:hypothetical protein